MAGLALTTWPSLRDLALFLADGQGKTDWATVQTADLESSSPCARQAGPGG